MQIAGGRLNHVFVMLRLSRHYRKRTELAAREAYAPSLEGMKGRILSPVSFRTIHCPWEGQRPQAKADYSSISVPVAPG